ncbi:hypothetical protein HPP92_009163 [Vanilla planifolia]|uniref:Trichome birefringence-like N-terminal domain-containing protein n=1 Tax=Vanilla planifolia TaxID=51239 RepID=A0A835RA39_VANPL|nr:hypothetical protein HPP92_009163 [Vanilla planifolia]
MAGEEGKPCSVRMKNGRRFLLVLFVAALVIGFSLYLIYSNPHRADVPSCSAGIGEALPENTRVQGDPSLESASASYIQLPGMNATSEYLLQGKCDIFSGNWICNPSGPVYTNNSCKFIEAPQNCLRNGRPDAMYLYWRWKPNGCDLPQFDSFGFLNAMKDKSWAFIGDSIFRNHIQSMLCLLSKVYEPVEIYHDETFKSRTWYFSNHNFTVAMIWAPFLVKSETFEDDDGKASSEVHLYIDVLDNKWAAQYSKYDYVIFSGGQWFLKTMVIWEDNTIVGCHNCKNSSIKEVGIDYPYRKVLQTVYHFMSSTEHKPIIFFRTWTPDHFEYGEWFSGGVCNRTRPYAAWQYNGKPVDHEMRKVELQEFWTAARRGIRLRLLDTFFLSVLRPDGHPGPYRTFHPFEQDKTAKVQNDCLHWCLPGPIDTWNELIMKILVDEGEICYT